MNEQQQMVSGLSCIVCGKQSVERFLDLGATALANKFLTKEELSKPEAKYPLRVGYCHTCGHVQLTEEVPPSAMFEVTAVEVWPWRGSMRL